MWPIWPCWTRKHRTFDFDSGLELLLTRESRVWWKYGSKCQHLTIRTQYRMTNITSNMKMNQWCQVANLSMDNGSRRREFNFSLRGLDLKVIFVFHHFNKKNFSSAKSSDSHAFLPLIQQQHHPLLQIKPVLNVNIQPMLFWLRQQDQTTSTN